LSALYSSYSNYELSEYTRKKSCYNLAVKFSALKKKVYIKRVGQNYCFRILIKYLEHQIAELTDIIPDLIMCGCVLHNICIDAGDVTRAEANAVDDRDDEDRAEIRAAFNRIISSPQALMGENADVRVQDGNNKRNRIFNYWINYNLDKTIPHDIDEIQFVFGNDAYLPFF
jgi:hypothetical protein